MKRLTKTALVVMLTFAFLFAFPGIIPDANTIILGKILVQGMEEIKNLEDTYEKVRQFTDLTLKTKNNIEKMLDMQKEVKDLLLTAKGIKDFKFADITYMLQKSTTTELDPLAYVPAKSAAASIFHKLSEIETTLGQSTLHFPGAGQGAYGAKLYKLYHDPTLSGNVDGSTKTLAEQLGLENYIAEQRGASYQLLNSFADRYRQEALEIESGVKKESLFSMNTAERMSLLVKAGDMMAKSAELKIKANEILQEAPPATIHALARSAEYLGIQASLADRAAQGRMITEHLFDSN